MNDLEKYFYQNPGRLIHKWKHYFEIYDRHFSKYRGTAVNVVEFGVFQGGSLQMWKNYFGKKANIYGIDINPHCKQAEEDQIKIFIGKQEDRRFLRNLAASIPKIDILIDDGGHTMKQQITTFEELFPLISANGTYLCEDTHTSYLRRFQGGYKRSRTFIEYSKNLIDQLHAGHTEEPDRLTFSKFTKTVKSIHFYSGIVVIEKGKVERPSDLQTGIPQIPEMDTQKEVKSSRLNQWLRKKLFG